MKNSAGARLSAEFNNALLKGAADIKDLGFSCLTDCVEALNELAKSTQNPFNIAVFGRMKTGKSSLVNALIGTPLAITGTEEATATINLIKYSDDPNMLDKYTVYWKGRPPETFPLSELQKNWTGKTAEVIERVSQCRYIVLYSDYKQLKFHEVIDTPGTGSNAEEHEDAAKNVLSSFTDLASQSDVRSDALVYVFPPVGRESDEDALRAFRSGCLQDSTPYNSIGVLHKWDHLYWASDNIDEIKEKAKTLKDAMQGMLADVIPVSAPLATAATLLPDEFYCKLKDIINTLSEEEIMRLLERDSRWDRDEERTNIRKNLTKGLLPWPSFQVLTREYVRNKDMTIEEFRNHIHELSGFPGFRSFLDRKFFSMGAIIRQKQNIAKLYQIRAKAQEQLEEEQKKEENDGYYWDELFQHEGLNKKVTSWLSTKRMENKEKCQKIQKAAINVDRIFIDGKISKTVAYMDSLKWTQENSNTFFSDDESALIQKILDNLNSSSENNTLPTDKIKDFANKLYVLSMFYPDRNARNCFQDIYRYLTELLYIKDNTNNRE